MAEFLGTVNPNAPISLEAAADAFTIHDLVVGGLSTYGRMHPTFRTEEGERPLAYTPDPATPNIIALAHTLTPSNTASKNERLASMPLRFGKAFNLPTQVLLHTEQTIVLPGRELELDLLVLDLEFEVPAEVGELSHFTAYDWKVLDVSGEPSYEGTEQFADQVMGEEARLGLLLKITRPFVYELIVPQLISLSTRPHDAEKTQIPIRHSGRSDRRAQKHRR